MFLLKKVKRRNNSNLKLKKRKNLKQQHSLKPIQQLKEKAMGILLLKNSIL